METSDISLIRAALATSDAVALAVHAPLEREIRNGDLVSLPVVHGGEGRPPHGAIVRLASREFSPASARFAEMVEEVDATSRREHPEWFVSA